MAQIRSEMDTRAIGLVDPATLDLSLPQTQPDSSDRPQDSADLSEALFVLPEVNVLGPQENVVFSSDGFPPGHLSRGDWMALDRYGHPRPPAHLLYDADSQ